MTTSSKISESDLPSQPLSAAVHAAIRIKEKAAPQNAFFDRTKKAKKHPNSIMQDPATPTLQVHLPPAHKELWELINILISDRYQSPEVTIKQKCRQTSHGVMPHKCESVNERAAIQRKKFPPSSDTCRLFVCVYELSPQHDS